MRIPVSVSISQAQLKEIDEQSAKYGLKRSAYIQHVVRQFIRNHADEPLVIEAFLDGEKASKPKK